MIAVISLIMAGFALIQIWLLSKAVDVLTARHDARLKALESREPEKRVQAPVIPVREWEKPIDNFTPKKPETLRPNQVRGREVEENVYEFDSKL